MNDVTKTETLMWRHNSTVDGPICMKFGVPTQNDMPMMVQWWKSRPEVEFQYGDSFFFEIGSSNISAVDWDNSPKFGVEIDFVCS